MRLHLYFARKFLFRFLLVLLGFFTLFSLTETVEILRSFRQSDLTFATALRLAMLKTPASVYGLFPIITTIATLALFLGLARSSELVVTRAAGRSAMGALLAPVITAMLIGVFGTVALNPIVAATLKQYDIQTNAYKNQGVSSFSLSREGLWLRQGDGSGQWVIFAERANFDATRLFGVSFFEFSQDGRALRRIKANSARLQPGRWSLRSGKLWQLQASNGVPERRAESFDRFEIPSTLTSEQILNSFGDPSAVSFWDMKNFVQRLEDSGFSAIRHRVYQNLQIAQPLLMVAMVLIGAGFTMRHSRFGRTGVLVLMAVLFSFGIFFFRNFAEILGVNGQIPIGLAAWSPPIAGILLALGLLLHLEDG